MIELEPHRRFLFGVCYRMTGVAADAEDLVQQTFAKAIESPPRDPSSPIRPWLATVAINLSRDHLRARKKQAYVGPFLPAPISALEEEPVAHEPHEDGPPRYELLESVSFAFLVALEALSPSQRAVLLLRDVFDYSVRETAHALDMTETNVKVTHHRARVAMERYDEDRQGPRASQEIVRNALQAFVTALAQGDVAAVEKLLRDDVRALSDGGGEYFAARVPIHGPHKVAQFFTKVASKGGAIADVKLIELNGSPALAVRYAAPPPGVAPLSVTRVEVDAQGLITDVHAVLAPRKLTHVTL
ncbi:MAG: sigma-70 family RNA polymerase sigma factor [Polyangiales bacterium]